MADPYIRVEFPTLSVLQTRPPLRAEVHQIDYQHDMVVLEYNSTSGSQTAYRNGVPLQVTWGRGTKSETFCGYVLYSRQRVENNKHTLRVICIGASYPFKEGQPVTGDNVTLDQMTARVALAQNFDAVLGGTDRFVYETLTGVAGETTWKFLARLARRRGFTLFANRTTLYTYDPVPVLLADVHSAPLLNFIGGVSNVNGNLLSFVPQKSSDGAGRLTNNNHVLLGVDPRTAQMVGVSDSGAVITRLAETATDPRFRSFVKGLPIAGTGHAVDRIQGLKRADRWVSSAEAQAYGQADIRQGRGVVVSGVDSQNDGLWYVSRAVHRIEGDEHPTQYRYFVDLELLRDGDGLTGAPRRGTRTVRSTMYTPALDRTILQEATWRAASPTVQAVLR